MSIQLDKDQLLERLTQSLRTIEINSQLFDAEEIVAWMPIATELYKLLIDDRYGALILELFPDLKLHPPDKHMSSASDIGYLLQSPGFKTKDGRIKFDIFDLSAPKIDIQDWLKRDIIEVKGTRANIKDFVLLMRNNISAHTAKKSLGGKARAIERFGIITQAGITRPAFTSLLINIATYLVEQINMAIGRVPGSRLLLFDQHRLHEIAQQHNEAKDLMDKIVQGDVDLTDANASTARRKLENSANLLLLPELRLWALLIYTHLGDVYRFSYIANKDIRQFFRAISALENAKILFDVASMRQQALILFNLGLIYNAASASLGRLTCWRISFNYFQELINTVSPKEEPDLYIDAAYEVAWLSLKLLRLATAYKYFRLYRTRVNIKSTQQ